MKSKLPIIIVVAVVIIGGVYFYFNSPKEIYNNTTDIATSTTSDNNTETDQTNLDKTAINESNENYEITGHYSPEGLVGSAEVNAYINSYINDFQAQANIDMPDLRKIESAIEKYSLQIESKLYEDSQYVFHVLTIGEYTGGASDNVSVETFGYKISGESKVTLNEFVPAAKRDSFVKNLKTKLLAKNADAGVFIDEVAKLTFGDLDSFYVYNGEIVILFSKYEIAPGASGIVQVSILLNSI